MIPLGPGSALTVELALSWAGGEQVDTDTVQVTGSTYALQSAATTYAFAVDAAGLLRHLHWGKPVRDAAQIPVPMLAEVSTNDPVAHLTPEEHPAHGGFRYTETCLTVALADGSRELRLATVGHRAQGDELVVTQRDEFAGVELDLGYRVLADLDLVERWAVLRNVGDAPLVVESLSSGQLHIPATDLRLTNVHGHWNAEQQLFTQPVSYGKVVLEMRRGTSTHHHNPYLILDLDAAEHQGQVWFAALNYGGNFRAVVEQTQYGSTLAQIGLNDFDFAMTLSPGESVVAPTMVIGYSDSGFASMSHRLHEYGRRLMRRPETRPVLYNSWEAATFDVTCDNQIALARKAAAIGIELFVVDDGWFGQRHSINDGLGDWYVNPEKFPDGLTPLIDEVHRLGMRFGIWFEPESVNPPTRLFAEHPDWIYHIEGRESEVSRGQYTLNLTLPDVQPAIVSWQVDNEWGHEGSDDDYSPASHDDFRAFLEQKYETIDALNEAWGTIFWGQTYNDWDEIPMPVHTITTHNPVLKLDWARHRSASVNRFAAQQVEVIRAHKGAHQTVNHNYAGGWFTKLFDHAENAADLDFASYNNYPVWGGLKEPREPAEIAYTLDFIRGLRQQSFTITEQIMGAQGHDVIGYLPRPDQAKMWGYQAFAHGCNQMLWFRWRSMTRGAEQCCFGIIDHDNQARRKYDEVRRSIAELSGHAEVLDAPIHADVAVLYDCDNVWSWRAQPQSIMLDFVGELVRLYRPFYNKNLAIDVVPASREISGYKVVVLPVLQIIDDALAQRLQDFAEAGGAVVVSFRAGTKNRDDNMHFGIPIPGPVRDICGLTIEVVESLQPDQTVPIAGTGDYEGVVGTCDVWRDIVITDTAETLFRYDDPSYRDRAVITRNRVGAGQVVYVAGGVDAAVLDQVVDDLTAQVGLDGVETPAGLEWYVREGPQGRVAVALNHTDRTLVHDGHEFAPYESRVVPQ